MSIRHGSTCILVSGTSGSILYDKEASINVNGVRDGIQSARMEYGI